MVRHEYPFATGHVHRRVKLGLAQQMGAVGFLIAHPERGVGAVSGSSGRNGGAGIPALGIGVEAADVFRRSPDGTLPTARMVIDGDDHPARTRMLIADLPGRGLDWVVVSAHIDGHPNGESAIDNATGVAVALALARLLAPHVSGCPRGLRICLFSAEEWGLIGSRIWLERMDEAARRLMVINVNLDSVGGASGLTALTSGFERLDAWVKDTATLAGLPIATHLPLMANSDHANFAAHGIPAVRLIAGFNVPDSNLRLLLTAADTRDKVRPDELDQALSLAKHGALVWSPAGHAWFNPGHGPDGERRLGFDKPTRPAGRASAGEPCYQSHKWRDARQNMRRKANAYARTDRNQSRDHGRQARDPRDACPSRDRPTQAGSRHDA
jgi:hypothetical protein